MARRAGVDGVNRQAAGLVGCFLKYGGLKGHRGKYDNSYGLQPPRGSRNSVKLA